MPNTNLPTSSVPTNKEDENNIPSTSFKQQSEENIFSYKCNQCLNNIAFRTEEQLNAHSLCHSPARFKLKRKIGGNEKQKIFKCDVCQDCFDTNEALLEHFNSEKHLQKAAEKTGGGMEEDEVVRSRLNSNVGVFILKRKNSIQSNLNFTLGLKMCKFFKRFLQSVTNQMSKS